LVGMQFVCGDLQPAAAAKPAGGARFFPTSARICTLYPVRVVLCFHILSERYRTTV